MAINPLESIEMNDVGIDATLEGVELQSSQLDLTKLPDLVVSGTALIDFKNTSDVVLRSSISLALLFASRVATKAVAQGDGDEDDWLAQYTQALTGIGFRISGMNIVHSEIKKKNVSVHKAILPLLTLSFGGAAVGPVILQALKSLDEMDEQSPWITLFDRQTRRFDVSEMHFAAVNASAIDTTIQYAIARLHVETGETTILFFKLSETGARFDSTATTLIADNGLLASIEPKLRNKLLSIIDDTIAGAEI